MGAPVFPGDSFWSRRPQEGGPPGSFDRTPMTASLFMLMTCTALLAQGAERPAGASASGQVNIQIARDGTALLDLVLPDRPVPAEQFAADELRTYLQRISGARFVVVPEDRVTDRPCIHIGRTALAKSVLAELDSEDVDTFVVRPIGRDLVLVGASGRGTLYAAYDLLEEDLGCRWLAPGEAWEEVPSRPRITLSIAARTERPGLKYRYERMTCLPTAGLREKDCLTWAVRQRINIAFDWPAAGSGDLFAPYGGFRGVMRPHSLCLMTDFNELYREHPDWFARVKGQRRLGSTPTHTNLCTSNPDVIVFVTGLLASAFDEQPQAEFLALGPGDGLDFCECERCRALDTGGVWDYGGNAHPALADRWLTFVNAVADGVAVRHPTRKLYTLAYHHTFAPPVQVKPRPNVMVMVVNSRPEGVCFVHKVETPGCPNNALFRRNLSAWSSIAPAGVLAYQYMPHSTFCNMPLPAPHKFIADIRWLSQAGCVGYEGQSSCRVFGLFGITLYAVAKAMWDPGINPDALIEDYCDSAFHESSEAMQSFFLALAEGQRRADHTSTGVWTSFTPEVLSAARRYMDKARGDARGEKVKRRLRALDAHLKYAEEGYGAYGLAQQAVRKRDPQLLDLAEKRAREAEAGFMAARQADPECVDLELPPKPLDRMLTEARGALNKAVRSRPAPASAEHRQ